MIPQTESGYGRAKPGGWAFRVRLCLRVLNEKERGVPRERHPLLFFGCIWMQNSVGQYRIDYIRFRPDRYSKAGRSVGKSIIN